MPIIVDRRNTKSLKNSSNRSRFIKRYKHYLKRKLDKIMEDKKIQDSEKSTDISIDSWDIEEENISFDTETGERDHIVSGNENFEKGDMFSKNKNNSSNKGGSGENSQDEFKFTLTREEFFDIFFQDMELPNFIKESMIDTTKKQYKRAGFTKDGIPIRLDVLKTLEMSIARRISNKAKDKKSPFIDDVDLRYKNFINLPQPMLKAVMFCVMDVSGSMEFYHKMLSKKFFIFLYLFLCKNYQSVDLRFIRYHHSAKDVSEEEFFYGKDTGGTDVMEAFNLVNNIIDEDYPENVYNIYISHTSDGDYWYNSDEEILSIIDNILTPKVQYYAYLQVLTPDQYVDFCEGDQGLYGVFSSSKNLNKKLNIEVAIKEEDIFSVLQNLFKKEK